MEKKRYRPAFALYHTYFLVECPKCKKEAETTFDAERWNPEKITIKCRNCMYKATLADFILYKVEVNRNCPQCGKVISAQKDNLKEPLKELRVTCSECKFTAEYTAKVSQYTTISDKLNGLKGDYYFGFPLWLQTEIDGHQFWARNREHLEEIRSFVEAELREGIVFNRLIASRLPLFVKSAKNREKILNAIDKMKRK